MGQIGHKSVVAWWFGMVLLFVPALAAADTATTTLHIDICYDGIVTGNEVCDLGPSGNTGLYSTSTANRTCLPDCSGYGPYCGDSILQPARGEECDDGNNVSGDRCNAVCQIEDLPSGGGGGGSGGIPGGGYVPPRETRVIIQGKAYPNASVHILKEGEPIGIVEADAQANFYFTATNVAPGVSTFGFWAEDNRNLKSIALTTTLTVVSGAVTTISGALVPPTITLDKRTVKRGEPITFSGQSVPQVTVQTHVNSEEETVESADADTAGNWQLAFDTTPLANNDFHTARALFTLTEGANVIKSAFSQAVSFYVGEGQVGKQFLADLNGDGKVNLIDVSILLFHWNTPGPIGDLNEDQKVNLADFSIMLFYWTG